MKITSIDLLKGAIYPKNPFKVSFGSHLRSDEVIVKIYDDDGNFGIGEASPTLKIVGESQGSVLDISSKIGSILVGSDLDYTSHIFDQIDSSIVGNSTAKAAFDIAIYDLMGKERKLPISSILGKYREKVESDVTIGIMNTDEAANRSLELVKSGIKTIKLKVGDDIETDVERVKAVRESVGNKARLFIDANQGWSPKRAVSAIEKFSKFDIEFVEQPTPANDIEGLAFVRKNTNIPIMADESIHSPSDALRAIELGAVDMVNIKLMKCGGIHNALKIATICETAGIPNMVGCMLEGAFGIAAGIHFSLSAKNVFIVDLDSDRDSKNTLTSNGILPFEGCYRHDDGYPGLGNLKLNSEEVELVKSVTVKEGLTSI